MNHLTAWKRKAGVRAAAMALLSLSLAAPLAAVEKRKGAEVVVLKKDGRSVRAELLAVKDDRLILMDASTLSDATCAVEDIRSLRLVKRAKTLKGLSLGGLLGGAAGAGLGLMSGDDERGLFGFTAGQKALLLGAGLAVIGGAVGGTSGALAGIDQSVDLEGRSSQELERILRKLDKEARFPQGLPGDRLGQTLTAATDRDEYGKATEVTPSGKPKPVNSSAPDRPKGRFKRIHLTYRPGYARPQAVSRCAGLFSEIGFGDTRPARDVDLFGISFGTIPPTEFPKAEEWRSVTLKDIRVDYSITRKLAVGIGFSILGEGKVEGYKYIPLQRGGMDYYTELYLNAGLSGRLYYLMVSWMPLPDGFIRKTSFAFGAGAGWGRLDIDYSTSKSSSSGDSSPTVGLSKNAFALLGTAEFHYFFNRTLSLGLNAEYRYAPVRVGSFRLTGSYYDLSEDFQLIEAPVIVDVPAHKLNAGGFRFGMSIGLHL